MENLDIRYILITGTYNYSYSHSIDPIIRNPKTDRCHFFICPNGLTINLLSLNRHTSDISYKKSDIKNHSIHIVVMNAGQVHKEKNHFFDNDGNIVPTNKIKKIREANGSFTYWERYPQSQINSCIKICNKIFRKYPHIRRIIRISDFSNDLDTLGKIFPWFHIKTFSIIKNVN